MFKKLLVIISLLVFTFSLSACATTKKKVKRHRDPTATEAKEDIVVVDATAKKPEGAITRLTKAIKKNPRDVRAYSNRGDAYLAQGNYRYAISDYTRILQIDPLSSHTFFRRAFAHAKLGHFEQALVDYGKVIEIDPYVAQAYFNRADIYGKQGRYDQTIADCTKAIKIDPRVAAFYNNRAAAYFFKKEYDKAWTDVAHAQTLGWEFNPKFMESLKKVSGRQK